MKQNFSTPQRPRKSLFVSGADAAEFIQGDRERIEQQFQSFRVFDDPVDAEFQLIHFLGKSL